MTITGDGVRSGVVWCGVSVGLLLIPNRYDYPSLECVVVPCLYVSMSLCPGVCGVITYKHTVQ